MPKRTATEMLMEVAFDNKEILSNYNYLKYCDFAKKSFDMRSKMQLQMEAFASVNTDKARHLRVLRRGWIKSTDELSRCYIREIENSASWEKEHALYVREHGPFLGEPSSHGGIGQANATDLIYRNPSLF